MAVEAGDPEEDDDEEDDDEEDGRKRKRAHKAKSTAKKRARGSSREAPFEAWPAALGIEGAHARVSEWEAAAQKGLSKRDANAFVKAVSSCCCERHAWVCCPSTVGSPHPTPHPPLPDPWGGLGRHGPGEQGVGGPCACVAGEEIRGWVAHGRDSSGDRGRCGESPGEGQGVPVPCAHPGLPKSLRRRRSSEQGASHSPLSGLSGLWERGVLWRMTGAQLLPRWHCCIC